MNISEAKIFISSNLVGVANHGFGNLEVPLRTALFSCITDDDWKNKIIPEIIKANPEL